VIAVWDRETRVAAREMSLLRNKSTVARDKRYPGRMRRRWSQTRRSELRVVSKVESGRGRGRVSWQRVRRDLYTYPKLKFQAHKAAPPARRGTNKTGSRKTIEASDVTQHRLGEVKLAILSESRFCDDVARLLVDEEVVPIDLITLSCRRRFLLAPSFSGLIRHLLASSLSLKIIDRILCCVSVISNMYCGAYSSQPQCQQYQPFVFR
jgi:hypothetical protein